MRKTPKDQYARLYSPDVVETINALHLPRYGLGNYVAPSPDTPPTRDEAKALQNLSRAGKRLMGFCRTNLFKRLEIERSGIHPVRRAAHPAQLRLSPCHRDRETVAYRHPGFGAA